MSLNNQRIDQTKPHSGITFCPGIPVQSNESISIHLTTTRRKICPDLENSKALKFPNGEKHLTPAKYKAEVTGLFQIKL